MMGYGPGRDVAPDPGGVFTQSIQEDVLSTFGVTKRIPPAIPRATASIAQIAVLILLTGMLFGVICIAVVGGAYVAITNVAH